MVRGLRAPGSRPLKLPPTWALVTPALFLVLLALDLWYQPLWAFDSWAFWTPRAYGLFALDGLDTDWFTSFDMLGGARRDYPLLLPAVEAAGFRFMGYQPWLLDIQSWLFLVGLLVAIVELSAGRARSVVLAAILAMVVIAPSTAAQLANAEADIPLAVFFAASGMFAMLWLETRQPATLALAAVLATGAVAVKLEGPIFVGAMFVALAACVWQRSRRDAAMALGALAVVIALGVMPWRLWVLDSWRRADRGSTKPRGLDPAPPDLVRPASGCLPSLQAARSTWLAPHRPALERCGVGRVAQASTEGRRIRPDHDRGRVRGHRGELLVDASRPGSAPRHVGPPCGDEHRVPLRRADAAVRRPGPDRPNARRSGRAAGRPRSARTPPTCDRRRRRAGRCRRRCVACWKPRPTRTGS